MSDALVDSDHLDAIFDCLAHPRRRYVLRRLREVATPLALADLAADVAAWEAETARSELDEETVQDVRVALYHSHVPKLAEVDLVQYDRDRGVVELSEFAGDESPLLNE